MKQQNNMQESGVESNISNELEVLIIKAKAGNVKAFEEIIRLKSESILYHALNIMKNYQDAEDAAQDAVINIYKHLKGLQDPKAFNGWMHRIVSNVCYSAMRKKAYVDEKLDIDNFTDIMKEDDEEIIPHSYIEIEENKSKILAAINSLPEKRQRMITMFYYDDMSYEEIAYAFNTSKGAVASHLSAAKKYIKLELEKQGEHLDSRLMSSPAALSYVIVSDVKTKIPGSMIDEFVNITTKEVTKLAHPFVGNFLAGSKTVLIITIVTIIAGAGVASISSNINNINYSISAISENDIKTTAEAISIPQVNGQINFTGQCDCGHLNPTKAELVKTNGNTKDFNWILTNLDTESEFASGTGKTIEEEIIAIFDNEMDGDYKVVFEFIDDASNKYYVEREFCINTGEISSGQYN